VVFDICQSLFVFIDADASEGGGGGELDKVTQRNKYKK